MDRYRDHSNAAAIGVITTLVVAGVVSWLVPLWAFFSWL